MAVGGSTVHPAGAMICIVPVVGLDAVAETTTAVPRASTRSNGSGVAVRLLKTPAAPIATRTFCVSGVPTPLAMRRSSACPAEPSGGVTWKTADCVTPTPTGRFACTVSG